MLMSFLNYRVFRSGNNVWQTKSLPSSSIISNTSNKMGQISKLPKEMPPYVVGNKLNMNIMKAVKVSVVNDLTDQNLDDIETLSITIDVCNNKPVELMQKKSPIQETPLILEASVHKNNIGKNLERKVICTVHGEDGREKQDESIEKRKRKNSDDYQSPLQALLTAT